VCLLFNFLVFHPDFLVFHPDFLVFYKTRKNKKKHHHIGAVVMMRKARFSGKGKSENRESGWKSTRWENHEEEKPYGF